MKWVLLENYTPKFEMGDVVHVISELDRYVDKWFVITDIAKFNKDKPRDSIYLGFYLGENPRAMREIRQYQIGYGCVHFNIKKRKDIWCEYY